MLWLAFTLPFYQNIHPVIKFSNPKFKYSYLAGRVVAGHRIITSGLTDVVSHQEAEWCGLVLLQVRLVLGLHRLRQLHWDLTVCYRGLRQLELVLLVVVAHKVVDLGFFWRKKI